ncbi:C-C chemokine receptor type 6a [Brienomyrus brachyistius]|uniref:C-C chemokine receptor type 6a n=1 Tax=Brienomyrus brachyistius TaxID=42636 RepID=UPI0020B37330|nr:C-C chemokine receptor type 6a [Brienomyrus brachyistius]XP_048841361.1 C-C chemokine receptor type 6a [Brienomyrus brachyistius]
MNNTSFVEPCDLENKQDGFHVARIYIHAAVCVLGLLGNILVIVTYTLYKRAKSMTDVYLLNVAIADLMFVVTLPLIIYNEQYDWVMGDASCKLLRGIYSVNLYSGMLLLACISGDRYLAIVQARRSFGIRSKAMTYSRIICVAVWVLALSLSVPTFMYSEKHSEGAFHTDIEYFHNDEEWSEDQLESEIFGEEPGMLCYLRFRNNGTAKVLKVAIPTTQMVMGFLVPFFIMGFCYISIIITLLQAKNFQRHKAVRVVMAVVVVFIICHLPFNATLLYYTLVMFIEKDCSEEIHILKGLAVTESLAYLHCCLNPVLYAFIGVKFRNHFRKIMEDLWCLGKRYIYSRRSSGFTSEMYLSRKSMDGCNNDNGSSFTM